jgi:hypothetical protein
MSQQRIGDHMLASIVKDLSDRDMAIIRSCGELRLASALQLQRLHFQPSQGGSLVTAARTCRRTLSRLTDLGLLARLDRRVGGIRAGSASYVYSPGPLGYRVVDPERRHRLREPSPWFVNHVLAISELDVRLVEAERAKRFDILEITTEPRCWRRFNATYAGTIELKPDLFVSLGVGDFEHRWFIEVDMDTEHAPTLVRKASVYLEYLRSGHEQAQHGVFPRVAWQVPTPDRRQQVEAALQKLDGPNRLFVVVTPEQTVDVIGAGR